MDRTALAEFLRARREHLRPEDVGLPPGARRRAPGLRREEVAALAAMSTDYYTRLEQRRGPQPSVQMLASLARALRLTDQERDYLFQTAGHGVPTRVSEATHVAPALLRVLDRLTDTPALILSNLGETLVQNDLAKALFGDWTSFTGLDRYDAYRWFTRPKERDRYPADDQDRQGRAVVATLRAAYGSMGAKSKAGELVRALSKTSPEFTDHKTIVHPEVGPIEVDCQTLWTEDQSQLLLVLTAAPRSEAEEKLKLIAVLGPLTRS
jgi:transcriptional regulator with XRE-family HTH domain